MAVARQIKEFRERKVSLLQYYYEARKTLINQYTQNFAVFRLSGM